MANQIDLKLLIQLIDDQKDIETDLILDEGCRITAEDQAPLVKIINYFMNYLHALSNSPLQISLDLMGKVDVIKITAYKAQVYLNYENGNLLLDSEISDFQKKIDNPPILME